MRKISEKHLEAYKTGCLKNLFNVVKDDPELSFEIRQYNEVKIYYRKKLLLTVKHKVREKNFKITPLTQGYYKNEVGTDIKISNILQCFSDEEETAKSLNNKKKIEDYFDTAKWLAYKHNMALEFGVQQEIALGNHSFDKRYLVVDMEWRFSQSGIVGDEQIEATQIDLVIVDTKANEAGTNDIYLAELKVGTGSADGKSGIADHIRKTQKLIDTEKACIDLKKDVSSLMEIKNKLGLFEGDKKDFNFSEKPKMMIIIAHRGKNELEKIKEIVEKEISQAEESLQEPLIKYFDLQRTL